MGADSTLVNAAFKLGQTEAGANVPNMAPLMQAQVGISAGFTKMARDAMGNHQKKKEIQRVGKSKQLKGFEKIFNNTLTSLYEQKEPLPQPFIDKLTSEIELLQEDFEGVNSYGKGDTSELARERARIMGELKRKSNEIINFRAGLEQFAIDRQNGLINEGLVKQKNISPAMMALDLKNFQKNYDAGNAEVGYDENGSIGIMVRNYGVKGKDGVETFNGEDVFVTIESLNKTFPKINLNQDAGILERQNESAKTGKVDGLKPNAVSNYNREERYSEYFDGLDTDDAISNIVARKIKGVGGMHPSFQDALSSDINIPLSILDTMFYDDDGERVEVGLLFKDLDLDGVDGITQKDHDLAEKMGGEAFEMFETNLDAMIDVITNVNNPAFDRERSAGMLAEYLTSMDEEKYNAGFDAAVKSKEKTTDRDGLTQSYGFRTYGQLQGIWDLIDAGGAIIKGPDGTRWLDQGDGTWKHDGSEVVLDKNGLKDQFELNHLPKFGTADDGDLPPVVNTIAESDLTFDIFKGSAEAALDKLLALKYDGINYSKMTSTGMFGSVLSGTKTLDTIKVFSGDNEIILDFSRNDEESARVQLDKLNNFIEQHRKK